MRNVDYFGISYQELEIGVEMLQYNKDNNSVYVIVYTDKPYTILKSELINLPHNTIYMNPQNITQDITPVVKVLKFRNTRIFSQKISITKEGKRIDVRYVLLYTPDKQGWNCIATDNFELSAEELLQTNPSIHLGFNYGYGSKSFGIIIQKQATRLGICTQMKIMIMKVMDVMLAEYDGGLGGILPSYQINVIGGKPMCMCMLKSAIAMGKVVTQGNKHNKETITFEECENDPKGEYIIRDE